MSQPVSRALRLVFALQGHSFEGLRLKQLADVVGESSSTTLRDLQLLEREGMAERIPGRDENWRLTPRLVQVAIAHQIELDRLQNRLSEFQQRYSRNP